MPQLPPVVDSSSRTHLAVCALCGWRGRTTLSKADALAQAVRHEREMHPGERRARSARDSWSRKVCR